MPVARRASRWLVVVGIGAVGAGLVAWGGYDGLRGARELQAAAAQIDLARDAPDAQGLASRLREADRLTGQARAHLDNPVLRAGGVLPVVGPRLRLARALATASDLAVSQGALPLIDVAGRDVEDRLVRDGVVDLPLLSRLAVPAEGAAAALRAATQVLSEAPQQTGTARLDDARTELAEQLGDLRPAVEQLALAAEVGPGLLGADRARRYLLVPQNPDEARGTGGLVGGYVLLEASKGRLRVVESAPNSSLPVARPRSTTPVVTISDEYDDKYGANGPALGWVNSNLSPHFPYTGQTWKALWEKAGREPLDGVLAVDPIALSYVLDATGPVEVGDGSQVTSANAVDLILRDVYSQTDSTPVRDAYLQRVSQAVAGKALGATSASRGLLEALAKGTQERRVLLWVADPVVQRALGDRRLTGQLPTGPAVGDVVVDAIASKLGYYLDRALTYRAGCDDGNGRLSVRYTNGAPATGLPDYVSLEQYRGDLPKGTNRFIATLYIPPGATPGELTVGGQSVPYRQGTERRLGWVDALVTLEPGQSTDVALSFQDTTPAGTDVETVDQPLVRPETVTRTPC